MPNGLLSVTADLSRCPVILPEFQALRDQARDPIEVPQESVTFGDKHGNVLRKIYELILVGVLDVTNDQYNTLSNIYHRQTEFIEKKSIDALKTDIIAFKTIVTSLPVYQHLRVIDIGDLFADRGEQDVLMFILFLYLNKQKLSFSIHYSNHDDVMFRQYANSVTNNSPIVFKSEIGRDNISQDRSWINLGKLIELHVISEESIKRYISELKNHLTLLSSELIDDHLLIRSHAPIDLRHIDTLLAQMKIIFTTRKDETLVVATQRKIEAINNAFKKMVDDNDFKYFEPDKNFFFRISHFPKVVEIVFSDGYLDTVNALHSTIWSRVLEVVNRESDIQFAGERVRMQLFLPDNVTHITFMFGHVGENNFIRRSDGAPDPRFMNIESDVGKGASLYQGKLTFFYTGKSMLIAELADRHAIEWETRDNYFHLWQWHKNIVSPVEIQPVGAISSRARVVEREIETRDRSCCVRVSQCMSSFFHAITRCCQRCCEDSCDAMSLTEPN